MLKPVGGNEITGRLVRLDSVRIELESGQLKTTLGIQDVVQLQFVRRPASTPPNCIVVLVDGSVLNAKSFESVDRQSPIELQCEARTQVENRNIHSVRFESRLDSTEQERWSLISRFANPDIASDALIVKRKGNINAVEGIIGDINQKVVEFSVEERTAKVNREKMLGLVFYHAPGRKLNSPIAIVQLVDGSTLQAKELGSKHGQLEIETSSGVNVELSLDTISRIDFGSLRSKYLSDLNPTTIDWQPIFASPVAMNLKSLKLPRLNTGYQGRPLQLRFIPDASAPFVTENRQFEKGLSMSGGSRIAFALNGDYENLAGSIGFDPLASQSGKVALIIETDGKTLLSQQLQNSKKSNPLEIDLNISGAQRLVIKVDYADGRAIGDILNLCDLKLTK